MFAHAISRNFVSSWNISFHCPWGQGHLKAEECLAFTLHIWVAIYTPFIPLLYSSKERKDTSSGFKYFTVRMKNIMRSFQQVRERRSFTHMFVYQLCSSRGKTISVPVSSFRCETGPIEKELTLWLLPKRTKQTTPYISTRLFSRKNTRFQD